MDTTDFEITDIEYLNVNVYFDPIEFETIYDKLKSIERGFFISSTIKHDTFAQLMKKYIPLLQLGGDGFQIAIFNNAVKLTITSGRIYDVIDMSNKISVPPQKLFAKDNLQKLNVDFNAVVSHVLGILHLDYNATKLEVKIELNKNGADYQTTRLSESANPVIHSLLGESIEIQSTDIAFKTKEVFLDIPVNVHYSLIRKGPLFSDKSNTVEFSGKFSGENRGIQDLNVILEEYMKRINNVVRKLTGGLKVNEQT